MNRDAVFHYTMANMVKIEAKYPEFSDLVKISVEEINCVWKRTGKADEAYNKVSEAFYKKERQMQSSPAALRKRFEDFQDELTDLYEDSEALFSK